MNTAPKIEPKQWLITLSGIGHYMGWSGTKVKRQALKYGFPVWQGTASVPGALAWMTTVEDIEAWCQRQRDESWQRLAASGTGKRLMSTRDKSPRRPSRYLTKAANDRLMPTTNV